MNKEGKVTLIVGGEIAEKLVRQEAFEIRKGIKNLREESSCLIPLIHITDGTKIATDYEIRVEDKKVLVRSVLKDADIDELVKTITNDIEKVCKQYL